MATGPANTILACGPLTRIDGPLPIRPLYGLLQAAEAPAAGVQVIVDTDSEGIERWGNGAEVFPYPADVAKVDNSFQPGSEAETKGAGTQPATPQFGAFTIYLPIQCTNYRVWNDEQFRARAVATLTAVESAAIAREIMSGEKLTLNPHLTDGVGTFPNGSTVTSALNGVALLEKEIAASGRLGLIHVPPQVLMMLASKGFGFDNASGVWRTPNGNVIVPDAGYANSVAPTGHTAASGTQDWIYATGPIEVRRSEVFMIPEENFQAIDRSTNQIVYRAERNYLVIWDQQVQAAVRVDRCQDTC